MAGFAIQGRLPISRKLRQQSDMPIRASTDNENARSIQLRLPSAADVFQIAHTFGQWRKPVVSWPAFRGLARGLAAPPAKSFPPLWGEERKLFGYASFSGQSDAPIRAPTEEISPSGGDRRESGCHCRVFSAVPGHALPRRRGTGTLADSPGVPSTGVFSRQGLLFSAAADIIRIKCD